MWLLHLLRYYNILSHCLLKAWTTCRAIYQKVSEVFQPNCYILYEGIPVACKEATISSYASGSAQAQWIYDADEKTFFSLSEPMNVYECDSKNFPILSLDIVERGSADGHVHYDLTDFIENMTVYTMDNQTAKYPSIQHLLAAWTTHSHVLLNTKRFDARMIDVMANTHQVPITEIRTLDVILDLKGESKEQKNTVERTLDPVPSSNSLKED